ncbi:MAG: hypothetical protein IKC69_03400 [Clostridia bacterium]|nr:hypothetical protein [Clostridia bacterium]
MRRVRVHYEMGLQEERDKIEGILKDRFRLIPPAVAVFSRIARHYGKDQFFICRCGVREGCLYHKLNLSKKN